MLADGVVVMPERPGTIRAIVLVAIERPRRAKHQYDAAFRDCERQMKSLIFNQA